jgi:hypothetical protein
MVIFTKLDHARLNLNSPLLVARDEFKLEFTILFKANVRCQSP